MLGDQIQDVPDRIHEPVVRFILFQLVQDIPGLWREEQIHCALTFTQGSPPLMAVTAAGDVRGGCAESQSQDGQETHRPSLTSPQPRTALPAPRTSPPQASAR